MPKEITKRVYEAISFEKGLSPNYNKLIEYFIEEGLFINNKSETTMIKPSKEYIAFIKKNVEEGNILSLKESEVDMTITLFGKVGNIVSQYKLEVETPSGHFTRYGVNLFQIIQKDSQWFISSMCWDDREDKSLFEVVS